MQKYLTAHLILILNNFLKIDFSISTLYYIKIYSRCFFETNRVKFQMNI